MKPRLPKFLKAALLACFSVATFATTLNSAHATVYTWTGAKDQWIHDAANWDIALEGGWLGAFTGSATNTMRFTVNPLVTRKTPTIQFDTLSLAGITVDTGAIGYSILGNTNNRDINFRADETSKVTNFLINDDFALGSATNSLRTLTFHAGVDMQIAAGKTFSFYARALAGSTTVKVSGGGTLAFFAGTGIGQNNAVVNFTGSWEITGASIVDLSAATTTVNMLGSGSVSLDVGSLTIGNKTLTNFITVKGVGVNTLTSTGGIISNALTINAGATLNITGSGVSFSAGLAGTGTVNVATGTTVTFSGAAGSSSSIQMVNNGTVAVNTGSLNLTGTGTGAYNVNGGNLNIAGSGATGTLSAGSITMTGGSLSFDLSSALNHDKIVLTGNLKLGINTEFKLAPLTGAIKAGTYILVAAAGLLDGADVDHGVNTVFNFTGISSRGRQTITLTSNALHQIILTVVGEAGTLKWNGGTGVWNNENTNTSWLNTSDNNVPISFLDADEVSFTADSEGTITLQGALSPIVLKVTGGTHVFESDVDPLKTGKITGAATKLFVSGGSLTLSLDNDFGGGSTLEAGTLMLGHASALGSGILTYKGGILGATVDYTFAAGKLVFDPALTEYFFNVGAAATLSLTESLALHPITKLGAGRLSLRGNGDITANITLTAGELAYNVASGATATFTAILGRQISGAGTLVKTGAGTFILAGLVANTFTGGITIEGGTIELKGVAATAGSIGSGTVTVKGGGILFVNEGDPRNDTTRVFNNNFVFIGGATDKAIFRTNDGWTTFGIVGGTTTMEFRAGIAAFSLGWGKTTTFNSQLTGSGEVVLARRDGSSERPIVRFLNQNSTFDGKLTVNANVQASFVANALSTANIYLASDSRLHLENGANGSLDKVLTVSDGYARIYGMGTSTLSLSGGISSVTASTAFLQGNVTLVGTNNNLQGTLAGGGGEASNVVIGTGVVVNASRTQAVLTGVGDAPFILAKSAGTATAVWHIAGTLNILDGSMVLQDDGAATLNMQSGGIINAKGFDVAAVAGKTVTLNLDSGTINIGASGIYARTGDNAATRVMNLAGGTLGALADWSSSIGMVLKTGTATTFNTDKWDASLATPAYTGTGTTITLTGVLSGDGALVKTGVGTLVLNSIASTGAGANLALTVSGGILQLGTVAAGTANSLNLGAAGILDIGGVGTYASVTSSTLTAAAGAKIRLDFNGAAATNDVLTLTGAFSGKLEFILNNLNADAPLAEGYYLLMSAGASLALADFTYSLTGLTSPSGSRKQYSLQHQGADQTKLFLYSNAGTAQTLTWTNGMGNNTWETGQTGDPSNWSGATIDEIPHFFNGDSVIFTTANAGAITLSGDIKPQSISITGGDYTFTGSGIANYSAATPTSLSITGGSLILNNAGNTATGEMSISAGASVTLGQTGKWAGNIANAGTLVLSRPGTETQVVTIGGETSTIRSLTGTGTLKIDNALYLRADHATVSISNAIVLGANLILDADGKTFNITGDITQDATNRTLTLKGNAGATGGTINLDAAITLDTLALTRDADASSTLNFKKAVNVNRFFIGFNASSGNADPAQYALNVSSSITTGQFIGAEFNNNRYTLNLEAGSSLKVTGGASVKPTSTDATASMILAYRGFGDAGNPNNMTILNMKTGSNLSVENATMYYAYDGSVTWNMAGGTAKLKGLDMTNNGKFSWLFLTGGEIMIGANGLTVNATNSSTKIELGNGILGAYETWTTASNADMLLNASTGTTTSLKVEGTTVEMKLAGILSGTGSLVKTGDGKLSLTGANTASSKLTVSAGSVELTGAAGIWAGEVSLASAGKLIFNRTNDLSFTQIISGEGGIVKEGNNTLTLSGANSYAGDTSINGGTLLLSAANNLGTTGKVLLGGATLDLAGVALAKAVETNNVASVLKATTAYTGAITVKSGALTVDNAAAATNTFGAGATLSIDLGGSFSMKAGQTASLTNHSVVNKGTLNVGSKMYLNATGTGLLALGTGILYVGGDLAAGSITQGSMSSDGGTIYFDLDTNLDVLNLGTGSFTQTAATTFFFTSVPESFAPNSKVLLMTANFGALTKGDFIIAGLASTGSRQTLDFLIENGGLYLHASAGLAQSITWNGTVGGNTWKVQDNLDPWTGAADGNNQFFNNDTVNFTATATEQNVSISGIVIPRTINVTGGEYTFTSADAASGISGSSTLNVSGVGTSLDLASANAATGIMSISAGGTVNLNATGAWSGDITLIGTDSTLNVLADQSLTTTKLSIGLGSAVNIGNGGTLGSWAGSIENNGLLTINRSDATTLEQALTGTQGTLSQVGTGILTLTGDTTATGMTLSIANNSSVNLGAGGATGSWAGTIAMGGADSNLFLNRTGDVTLKQVTGMAGTITLMTGNLQLGEASGFGNTGNTIKLVLKGGSLVAVAANSSFSNVLDIQEATSINNAGHKLDLSGSVIHAAGKTLTLSGAGTTVFSGAASLGAVALNEGTLTLNNAAATLGSLTMSSGTTIKTGSALADTDVVRISGATEFGEAPGQSFTLGDGASKGSLEFEEMNPNWSSTVNINQNVITDLFRSMTNDLITLNIATGKNLTAKSWGDHGNQAEGGSIRQTGAGTLIIQGFHANVGRSNPIDMQAGTLEFNIATETTGAYVIQSSVGTPVFKKTGAGNLVLTNANTATQTLLVETGILTLGGANGAWAGTIDLANNTSLFFNHTGDFSTADANLLTGAGIVHKDNAGKLTLNGLSSAARINLGAGILDMADKAHSSDIVVASGDTASLVNAGSRTGNLNISGTLTTTGNVGGTVSLLAGGQLNLEGAMSNTVSVNGEATINKAATASWTSIALLADSTLHYQIDGVGSTLRVGDAQSLRIAKGTTLTGSLDMDGGTLELSLSGINVIPYNVLSLTNNGSFSVTAKGGTVKLVDVSGAIKGRNTFTLVAGMNPITKLGDLVLDMMSFDVLPVENASLRYDGNNLLLDLTVAARLYWNGAAGSNTWDMTSENWLVDGNAGQAARFETNDFVVFDSAAGTSTDIVLSSDVQIGSLKPTTMTVTGASDYSFSGDGGISATGYLLKEGTGSLSFKNTGLNQFGRGIELREGKIIIDGAAGLSGDLKLAANTNLELLSSADSTLTKLSGAGNILIDGAGKVTLKGDQVSYTGGVTIKSGSLVNDQVIGFGAAATNKLNIEASGNVLLTGITGAHVGSLSTTVAGATVSGITGNLDLGTASFMVSTASSTTPIVQMEAGSSLSLGTVTVNFDGIFDPTQSFSFQLTNGILAGGILQHDEYGRYTNVLFGAGAFADFSVTDIQGGTVTIRSNEVFKDFVLDENNKWAPHITQGTKAEFTAAQFKAYDAANPAGQDFRSVTVDGVMRLLGTDAFTLNNLSGSRTLAYIGVLDGADVNIVSAAGETNNYAGQLDAATSKVTVTGNQGLGALNVGSLILSDAANLTLTGDANIVGALTLGNASTLTMNGSTTTVGGELTLGTGSSITGAGTLSIKAGGKLIAGNGSGIDTDIVLDLRAGTGSGSAAGELTLGSAEITVGGLKGGGIVSSVDGTLNLDVSSDQKFTGSLVGPDAAVASKGNIVKKGRSVQILAAKTNSMHLYNLDVEDGTLVIEGATDGSSTYYGAATVGGGAPSGGTDQTLVFATNATVSSLTTLGNGHLVIGTDGKAVNVTTSGNVVFASGSSLTMYVDTASNSGTIITTGTGAISGLDNLSDLTVVASSSWQAYVNIVLFKSDTKIDHLPTNITLEGFNDADVTYGNGDTSIIITGSRGRDENPYKQAMAGASQNANAGLDLIWDANVSAGEKKTNISASSNLGGVFDSLVNMGPGSAAANRLMAAVAGASVTALAGSQRDDFRQQQDWIRNRTTSMGISPDYVHEDLPYVNGWIQANGGTTRVSQDGDEAGYNMDTFGGTFGFDVDMSAKTTWGFAFTANYNKLTANAAETARGHNDAYYANLFLRTQNKRWANTFILTGGWNDATLDRTVVGSHVNYTAKGSTSGSTIGAMYETTYDYALNENKTSIFQPLLNVSFSSASMDAYTEEGAGNAGLKVEETKGTYGTIALGARLLGTVGENLFGRTSMGELRLQVAQDIGDDTNIAKVGLGGIQREVIGTKVGKTAIQVGAGISIPVNEQGSLYFDVNGEFRSKSSNVNGSIGYRINF